MEYKEEECATKQDLIDMIDDLKKGMPPSKVIVVEVHEDKTPVVVVVGCGSAPMEPVALRLLHLRFGADLIIIDQNQAVAQGIMPVFDDKPFIIKLDPPLMHEPMISIRREDDKPWYARFLKKRGKKRHR